MKKYFLISLFVVLTVMVEAMRYDVIIENRVGQNTKVEPAVKHSSISPYFRLRNIPAGDKYKLAIIPIAGTEYDSLLIKVEGQVMKIFWKNPTEDIHIDQKKGDYRLVKTVKPGGTIEIQILKGVDLEKSKARELYQQSGTTIQDISDQTGFTSEELHELGINAQ